MKVVEYTSPKDGKTWRAAIFSRGIVKFSDGNRDSFVFSSVPISMKEAIRRIREVYGDKDYCLRISRT